MPPSDDITTPYNTIPTSMDDRQSLPRTVPLRSVIVFALVLTISSLLMGRHTATWGDHHKFPVTPVLAAVPDAHALTSTAFDKVRKGSNVQLTDPLATYDVYGPGQIHMVVTQYQKSTDVSSITFVTAAGGCRKHERPFQCFCNTSVKGCVIALQGSLRGEKCQCHFVQLPSGCDQKLALFNTVALCA